MEKAKQAIRDFTSKSGHHDTTVHSATAPAVEHETVRPQQHENINTAIDREVHQDHCKFPYILPPPSRETENRVCV